MELQDGFIVGISNYCDRWCETCAFTSRCRLFADVAAGEASGDPHFSAVVNAPLLPEDQSTSPPRWMQECLDEMNDPAHDAMTDAELDWLRPKIAPELERIEQRAGVYRERVHSWLRTRGFWNISEVTDPRAVIAWFHLVVPAKIHRALTGLAHDLRADRDWPADYDGSAKVALLSIERSHAAWLELVDRGLESMAEAAPLIDDLVWLGETLEDVFPNARSFVRPAFDEPESVATMLAGDDGGLP